MSLFLGFQNRFNCQHARIRTVSAGLGERIAFTREEVQWGPWTSSPSSAFPVPWAPRLSGTRVRLISTVALATLLVGAFGISSGQTTSVGPSVTGDTAVPVPGVGHDYLHLLNETVDPSSGSVNVNVQVPLPKSRGITLPFSINYSSAGVFHVDEMAPNSLGLYSSCPPNNNTIPFGNQCGWEYGVPSAAYSYTTQPPRTGTGTCYLATQYTFTDPARVGHNLYHLSKAWTSGGKTDCPHGTSTSSPSSDAEVSAVLSSSGGGDPITVYDTAGTIYRDFGPELNYATVLLPQQIEDRNGNLINATYSLSNNAYSVTFTDTSGRPSLHISGTGASGTTDSVTAGPLAISVDWTSTTASYSMPITQVGTPASGVDCPTDTPSTSGAVSSTVNAVSAIHLPNGQQYTFYTGSTNPTDSTVSNPYGLLNEIIYPNGGWVKYTYKESDTHSELGLFAGTEAEGLGYQLVPNACAYEYSTPVVATRTVSYDGTNVLLTQVFTYSTTFPNAGSNWSIKSTSVTTTVSGQSYLTQYSYHPYAITQPVYTTSTVAAELPLEYQVMTYDWGNTSSPLQTVTKSWADPFNMTEQDTTLGAVTSKITYSPGSFLPTETDEYDFGASSPTRKTLVTYQPITAPGTVVNEPCKTVITDGANKSASETDRYYDGSSTLCGADSGGSNTTSVTPLPASHDETKYGPGAGSSVARGNVTRLVRVLAGGPGPTTTFTYDETGQVVSMTDPCGNGTCTDMTGTGHTATYSYTDSPSGGNTYGNSNTYLTQDTAPNTGVAQIHKYQYDYPSGELIQTQDENNVITKYSYNDPLERLTLVDSAVGALGFGNYSTESKTLYSYPPSGTEMDVAQDQWATGDGALKSSTFYDGLGLKARAVGRDGSVVETAYDGLGRVCAVSNPTFNDPGPLSCVVGQNKATTATDGYTYFSYDALGRKTLQTQPDGNTLQWIYSGNVVDFYDEDRSHWQRTSDALGRLTKVLENDPAGSGALTLETDHTYDPLDNLTSVNQKGASGDTARYRTFLYDSLSRLTDACNPEAIATGSSCTSSGPWSAVYSFDANSNVITRTDARGVVTHYGYDALNRLITKTYTNDPANTPALSYGYDQEYPWQLVSNENDPVGHLNSIQATVGTTNVAAWASGDYDQRGNLTGYYTCLGSNVQGCPTAVGVAALISYDLNDSLAQVSAFSGNATSTQAFGFSYQFDNAGRLTLIQTDIGLNYSSDGTVTASNPFSGPTFYPGGAVETANVSANVGTYPGFTLFRTYDNRGRITGETDTNTNQQNVYSYSVSYDGNGNVTGYNDSAAGTWTVNNDALHRLLNMSGTFGGVASTAQETYDHFGNRNVETVTAGGNQMQPSNYLHFTAGNNRADEGVYDNAGNPFSDGTNNYLYDAENRICAVQQIASGGGGSLIGYLYAPNGTRLGKNANLTSFSCDMTKNGMLTANGIALTTGYDSGLHGEQLAVTDGQFNMQQYNIMWEGKVLGTFQGTTYDQSDWHFALNDWVGTKRVVTNFDGSYADSFFSGPFGDFQTASNSNGFDPSDHHFTGKERDIESGLDYFPARYYNSNVGRWMTPDYSYDNDPEPVPHADLENPQSLNLYSYVQNNPLRNVDPDGHICDQGTIGPDGTLTFHCQNDPPLNLALAGGAVVLANEELGPVAWGVGGVLLGVGCIQAHCGQAVATLFSKNDSNSPVPAIVSPNTGTPNLDPNNKQSSKKKTSRNQMQKQVESGQAPKTVDRVDPGLGPNEQDHIHFSDGNALNEDGTWKHGSGRPLTNAETGWIQGNGWNIPK